jgi:hypothetical protein
LQDGNPLTAAYAAHKNPSPNKNYRFGDTMAQYPQSPLMGSMMSQPLLISSLIQHADRYYSNVEIVSRRVEGDVHRYTYRDCHRRSPGTVTGIWKPITVFPVWARCYIPLTRDCIRSKLAISRTTQKTNIYCLI